MKFKPIFIPLVSLSMISLLKPAFAQELNGDSVMHVKATTDFDLNGSGNAENWKATSWVILPSRGNVPKDYQTQVKVLYSALGIYCLFQSTDKVISANLKGDFLDLYDQDVVEAFFWPDEKTPIYFEYELSPLNYELPILVPNNKGDFFGWLPWHFEGSRKTRHAVKIGQGPDDRIASWTAEFFIPFDLLKPLPNARPVKGTRWRANFYRIDYDQEPAEWSWRPTRINFHDYEKFGTLIFD